jgi:L-lysine exporter family protein LysE/ArgO
VHALGAGLFTGLSLIVAIGAQNAYVLRLGLTRQHVALAVSICIASDVMLIAFGIAGIGGIVRQFPAVLGVLKWVGVAYLVGFALVSFRSALRPKALEASDDVGSSGRIVAVTMLALTFLNPHVYLDTVLLLGSIGNQYGSGRWAFAAGAALGSVLWFSCLGFGARLLSPLMGRKATWRVLDAVIGMVMLLVALSVAMTHLSSSG